MDLTSLSHRPSLLCLAFLTLSSGAHAAEESKPVYRNAGAPVEERVTDLLSRMTLEEKVAQLNSISVRGSAATQEGIVELPREMSEQIRHGIGQVENTFDADPPRVSATKVNDIQRRLVETTRLGIPAMIGSECLHGHAGYNSTVLPTPLAMASSWNPDLVGRAFDMVGRESRARGSTEAHTPVLDMGRDPRWGRIEETYGEDTYLVSRMAAAVVSGLQGGSEGNPGTTHILSSPKHFAGYGQVVGGRNFAATPIETKTLFDEILPPFEVAVKEVGAQGMMASHCDIGGVPAHGNRWLLTELLKGEWGFEGMIVSDYNDIPRLEEFMHVAATLEDAARMALVAGMDMDLPAGVAFGRLVDVVREDPSLVPHLDDSVRRVLRLKFMLGLFENPYVDAEACAATIGKPEHVALAEELAKESIVLLKNHQDLLPLDADKLQSIAVIGPNATSKELGTYTMENDRTVTLLEGIRKWAGSKVEVIHEEGCKIGKLATRKGQTAFESAPLKDELPGIRKAAEAARKADVAIVCVGGTLESSREAFYRVGVNGDRATLGLLGNQEELVMQVIASGTPTIVVLMGGKPYAIPEIAKSAGAILNTFYLGETGGTALASVLSGETNPSGKLPVTVARSVGQLPNYYSQKQISFYKDYLDEEPGPLFPFGFGLSYTRFEYGDLKITAPSLDSGEPVQVSFTLKNTGKVAGAEVAQLYFRDEVASVIRPEKLLVRFEKVFLKPGEEKQLRFELEPAKDLSFTGIDMKRVVEPGDFKLMVGSSSQDLRLDGRLTLD